MPYPGTVTGESIGGYMYMCMYMHMYMLYLSKADEEVCPELHGKRLVAQPSTFWLACPTSCLLPDSGARRRALNCRQSVSRHCTM